MLKKIKISALIFFVLLAVFFTVSQLYILYKLDVSLAPVGKPCDEPVYLVSYADGHDVFRQNQNFQTLSALNKGIDFIFMYQRKHLDKDFVERNKEILSHKRGAGYWLWKPYIILKTLEQVPENAIVVYLDSGISIYSHLGPIINKLGNNEMCFVRWDPHPNQPSVAHILQRGCREKLGCTTEECLNAPHLWAAVGFYKNTPRTREFVKKWLKACEDKDNLIGVSGEPNQDPRLHCHINDEGILSALAALDGKGITSIKSEEFLQGPVRKGATGYAVWNHRHPVERFKSNLPYFIVGSNQSNMSNFLIRKCRKFYWVWTYPIRWLCG